MRHLPYLIITVALIAFGCLFIVSARKNYKSLPVRADTKLAIEPEGKPSPESTAVGVGKQKSSDGNFLADSSFEDQSEFWYSHPNWKTSFKYDPKSPKTGNLSALLELDSRQVGSQSTRVHGVVQDIKPEKFPTFLSGNYFVESWKKATKSQYLQAVVIVFDPNNLPSTIAGGGNYQIRYVLAGTVIPPEDFRNAKYIIINSKEPEIGKWIYFERNLEEDFKKEWGDVPKSFSSIRVFFEARWDSRTETLPVVGKVRYDDVFVGTKTSQPIN